MSAYSNQMHSNKPLASRRLSVTKTKAGYVVSQQGEPLGVFMHMADANRLALSMLHGGLVGSVRLCSGLQIM